jgi:hypothetical protein
VLRDPNEWFRIAAALAACMIAAGLFRAFGFLGVAALGLLILSAATRLELEEGSGGTGPYPRQSDDPRFSRAELAERRGERRKSLLSLRYAQMLGLAFLVVGGGGFIMVDLHPWR